MGGDSDSARDLSRRIEETLSRFGVAGSVDVAGNTATLFGHGPTVSTDVGTLVTDWSALPEDARSRRAADVARRLSSQRRSLSPTSSSGRGTTGSLVGPVLGIVAVVVVGFGALRGYEYWVVAARIAAAPSARVSAFDSYEHERQVRAAAVCDATRARVMRGAAVGPSDAEGWVVELWALRDRETPSPAADPALVNFVATTAGKGRLVWSGAPTLKAMDGPETSVTILEGDVPEVGAPLHRGVRLVFTGRYVTPYFDEAPRGEYVRLSRAVTDALGASYAALYTRCSDGTSHHIGSWFRGPTPGGAVASLVYFMGAFGPHKALRRSLLVPPGAPGEDLGYALESVASATAALKKTRVMKMLSSELGMIAGVDDAVSTVMFPFRDANRASRASYDVARELGIEEPR